MDWREAITRRWQFKVAALFLALLLWVTVTTDEQQEQAVPTRVDWVIRDSAYVLVEAPGQVQTVFQARMGELLSFVGNNPVLQYAVDSVPGPQMQVSLTTDMVQYGQAGNARALAVRPGEVVLRFEPRARRMVPVSAAVEVSPADGYVVVDSPVVQPDSVTVVGAESEVEEIRELTTEQAPFDDLQGRVSRDVPVRLPEDAANVQVDPEIVLVTADVDSVVRRTLRVPVGVRGADATAVIVAPDTVTVELRGPSTVLADLPADSVAALADLSGGMPEIGETRTVELSVDVSGFPSVSAAAEPSEVEVGRSGAP